MRQPAQLVNPAMCPDRPPKMAIVEAELGFYGLSVATEREPEPDEGNGPIVTIRDNMIALAIVIVIAAGNIFVTSHYHPWQLSSTTPTAHVTNTHTTVGCCNGTSQHLPR
jgi:hypothetical protein